MVQIEAIPFAELPVEVIDRWTEICEQRVAFWSPCFHPEFVAAVAAVRAGVEVGVIRREGQVAGLFPFERHSRCRGRPVGAGISDFQGVIGLSGCDVDIATLSAGCNLRSYRYDHWLVPGSAAGIRPLRIRKSPYMDLRHGFDAYFERRMSAKATRLRRLRQKNRKLDREQGPVVFTEDDADPAAWEKLFQWKSQQYQRTGVLDIFRYGWVREVLRVMSRRRGGTFRGRMMTLRANDRIIAVHFGIRTEQVVHWWFPAYDPAMQRYSPGLQLLMRGAEQLVGTGCQRIDLGKGDEPYKASVTSDSVDVGEGIADDRRLLRILHESREGVLRMMRRMPGKEYLRRPISRVYAYCGRSDFR